MHYSGGEMPALPPARCEVPITSAAGGILPVHQLQEEV